MAKVFNNADGAGDEAYLDWLEEHPFGSVLNTRRRDDPTYMVLHRASCHSIRGLTRGTNINPFTGRGYIKVCAETEADLLAWVRRQGRTDVSSRCSICQQANRTKRNRHTRTRPGISSRNPSDTSQR